MNRYAYTGYDPVNYVDPSGNFVLLAAAAGALIGAAAGVYIYGKVAKEDATLTGYILAGVAGGALGFFGAGYGAAGAAVVAEGVAAKAGLDGLAASATVIGAQVGATAGAGALAGGAAGGGVFQSNDVVKDFESGVSGWFGGEPQTQGQTRLNRAEPGGAPRTPRISASEAKRRLAEAYHSLGLDFGKPPTYNPDLVHFGETSGRGVEIGPKAFRSRAILMSTLIHEGVHVEQIRQGNDTWGSRSGVAVSEAEAYREELVNYQLTGLSEEEQWFVAGRYKQHLITLRQTGARGEHYLRRILIYENFKLFRTDRRKGPLPDWLK